MSNEREFVTIEPKSRWPALVTFSVIGAVVAVLALIVLRSRGSDVVDEKIDQAATAVVAAKPAMETATQAVKAAVNDPNVIKSPQQAIDNMVPAAVVDRYKERASAAEKRAKELSTRVAALEKQIERMAQEKEAIRRASLPPPPAQDEEVLQMLEPVLAEKIQ